MKGERASKADFEVLESSLKHCARAGGSAQTWQKGEGTEESVPKRSITSSLAGSKKGDDICRNATLAGI